mgnify:FL=1
MRRFVLPVASAQLHRARTLGQFSLHSFAQMGDFGTPAAARHEDAMDNGGRDHGATVPCSCLARVGKSLCAPKEFALGTFEVLEWGFLY